jgi:hypothetical protein
MFVKWGKFKKEGKVFTLPSLLLGMGLGKRVFQGIWEKAKAWIAEDT